MTAQWLLEIPDGKNLKSSEDQEHEHETRKATDKRFELNDYTS
jgi:hypothetical protein